MPKKAKSLTAPAEKTPAKDRHEMFCLEYLKDCNATQAAIRAGYSENSANVQASQLLSKPNIRTRIQELMAERSKNTLVDAVYVVERLKTVAERCMQATPVLIWDPVNKAMVQKIDENGNAMWEFDSNGANRALELLAKHVGMLSENLNLKHSVEQPLFGPGQRTIENAQQ